MRRTATTFALAASLLGSTVTLAAAQEVLKVAVAQRGQWDTAVAELGQREAPSPGGATLDLELEETIGVAIVEPVDDAPRLDLSRGRIVG